MEKIWEWLPSDLTTHHMFGIAAAVVAVIIVLWYLFGSSSQNDVVTTVRDNDGTDDTINDDEPVLLETKSTDQPWLTKSTKYEELWVHGNPQGVPVNTVWILPDAAIAIKYLTPPVECTETRHTLMAVMSKRSPHIGTFSKGTCRASRAIIIGDEAAELLEHFKFENVGEDDSVLIGLNVEHQLIAYVGPITEDMLRWWWLIALPNDSKNKESPYKAFALE